MKRKLSIFILIIAVLWVSLACKYVVIPSDLVVKSEDFGEWNAVVTNITKNENNDLHIDITIKNATGEWSAMQADPEKPVTLKSDGQTSTCGVVFIGTGGHRLAPGFQIRGYTAGTLAEPRIQTLYVECEGVEVQSDAELTINYVAYNGTLDYYHQDDNRSTGVLELSLNDIVEDITYPTFMDIENWVEANDAEIPAISNNVVKLTNIDRTDAGFTFSWSNYNPTAFALKTHIGRPPVVGDDGIIYGFYQIMDMVSVPLTPASGESEWTTDVEVPSEVKNLYILLSVEDQQMRLYVNHLIDLTEE